MNIKRRPAPIGRRRRGRSFKTGRPPGSERGRGEAAAARPREKFGAGARAGARPRPERATWGRAPSAPTRGRGSRGGGPAGRRDAAAPEEVVQSPPGSRCCMRCVPRSRQGPVPVPMSAGLFAGLGTAVRDGKGAESKM